MADLLGIAPRAWSAATEKGEAPPALEGGQPATSHQPAEYFSVVPSLSVKGADDVALIASAFGGTVEDQLLLPNGHLMHAEVRIGDSIVMLSGEEPGEGSYHRPPSSLGGAPVSLMFYTEDADAMHAQAVKAGATVLVPVAEMFWGDRWGMVADGSGNTWGVATHVKDLTPEQIRAAMPAHGHDHGSEHGDHGHE